jgi:phytoene dehydrogenase-like protein
VVERYDAVVVGAGPNGLSAAIVMARAGRSVLVVEANPTVGGAARTAELTLPGFLHDPFSAVYPLAVGSPFFRQLPLEEHGLEWVHAPAPLAHPFDDGPPAMLERSVDATAETLGAGAAAYRALLRPFAEAWDDLAEDVLAPLRVPRHPLLLARFGARAILSVDGAAKWILGQGRAGALFAGSAAHTGIPLDRAGTAAFGLVLHAAGHAVGWPIARGGAGAITRALASHLRSLGGEIRTGFTVRSLDDLPPARAVFLNLTARQVVEVAGDRLPAGYRGGLSRLRYGAGVFKVDWALSGPVPWRSPECARAGTVHLVGSLDELRESERRPLIGEIQERPFVLFSQPSLFDPSRAPEGKHTAWAYCHVPNGSTVDMTERIEAQVERFAPGFRDLVLARTALGPNDLELLDANLVGGDVNGGAPLLGQLFLRPMPALRPYSTPVSGLYLCSASTPPGGAVHGMCGYHAASAALSDGF